MKQKLNVSAKRAVYQSRKREGDIQRIADQNSNYSYSHVVNVLNGNRTNESIINSAYRMTSRRVKNSDLN